MALLPSTDEELIRASNSSKNLSFDDENILREIEVKNNSCKYKYYDEGSFNNLTLQWQAGKGLTYYLRSNGGHMKFSL
ncbi:MAG: hypothetical protein GX895_10285 [Clostridiales bacterium]|mgnify:CR=1 FL=1|uniref:hypothetical protein n=1 Tax=Clostridium sp. N3C TaxID=1776758 RepID=UPI00092E05B1|nr:hypothetical protein [Clostridium sp. N3C]NLZ49150.1 hypothetical protein [Clostridiales bacterium]SCN22797.1 hypothetical protein N3C_0964 [Clostridium sp. N3C]